MAGLIALSAFSEQTRLGYCRSKLQRERGLRLCDCKRLGQAVPGRVAAILRHGRQNLGFNYEQFRHVVGGRSAIRRTLDGLIDCKEGLIQLSALAQAISECAHEEAKWPEISVFGDQNLQRAVQQLDTDFQLIPGNGKCALQSEADKAEPL